MTRYRIAVIPGDGIGQEVVPAGLHVLEAAAAKHTASASSGTSRRGGATTTANTAA